jgi:UDP-N-acetylmuramoylalanine--D-glutamate ligase
MSDFSYDLTEKKVLVMGLGRFGGGVDVARFAATKGAKVIVTDLASAHQLESSIEGLRDFSNIEFHLGLHDASDFEEADIVIANPAVPVDNKFLQIARNAGKLVTSQINIFFELCSAKIVGITGSNGKSTTVTLTAHLLRNTSHESRATSHGNIWLSGNIGNQPLLTILEKIKPDDLVILELSSFQIEQLAQIKKAPDIALLTNLTPNHLDRYGTFEKYCEAKENIFNYQKLDESNPAISIFNGEDKIANRWYEKFKNNSGRHCIQFSADNVPDDIRDCYNLPGRANLSNLAAALSIAKCFGVTDENIKQILPEFEALPHRLELVDEIDGVQWYNDSKATTPEGAITALDAFDKPIILIAGGYDKNLPFDKLAEKIIEKTKAVILVGQTAHQIVQAINEKRAMSDEPRATKVEIVNSLSDAVQLAHNLAESGDIILLSPACASYDMFENYEQRGLEFTKLIKSLKK